MGKAYPYICAAIALSIPTLSSPEVLGWQISLLQAAFIAVGFYGRRVFQL